MSNLPIKDANDVTRKVDVFTRTEGPDTVETQAVVAVDPATGTPIDFATQTTVAALLVAAQAIQSAAAALNAKTTAVNTGAIAGTVAVSNMVSQGLTDTQLRASAVPVSIASVPTHGVTGTFWQATQPVSGPLTDAQLRAAAVPVELGATSLAALETINIAGTVPVSAVALPLPAGAATEVTLSTLASTVGLHNATFVDGSPGITMFGKRRDSDTTSVADGDLNTLNMDEEGRLKVASKPASYTPTIGSVISAATTIPINTERFSNLMIHCAGTFAGANCTFEGSLNSTNGTDGNWFAVQAIRSNANTIETSTGVLAAAPAYAWELSVNALKYFRIRATAWTSGTQVWTMTPGTYATEPIPGAQVSGTQPVSGTVGVTGYPTAAASADGLANPTVTQIGAAALGFNGTTWDRVRNNLSVAVDTSSARTASGNGVTFTNHNGRSVTFWLNVTAVSGTTPTMTARLQWSLDNGATWLDADTTNLQTVSIAGTGNFLLSVGPNLPVVANRSANQMAPRLMRLAWTIGGTTPSFTFTSWANTSA